MGSVMISVPDDILDRLVDLVKADQKRREKDYEKKLKNGGRAPTFQIQEWEKEFLDLYETFWESYRMGESYRSIDGEIPACEMKLIVQLRQMIAQQTQGAAIPALLKILRWCPEDIPEALQGRFNRGELPFYSEAYLYEVMGKEDARTFRAYMGNLKEALGISRWGELPEEGEDGEGT